VGFQSQVAHSYCGRFFEAVPLEKCFLRSLLESSQDAAVTPTAIGG
jgi:hypothetical protein